MSQKEKLGIQPRRGLHCVIKLGHSLSDAKTVAFTQFGSSPAKFASSKSKLASKKVQDSPRQTKQIAVEKDKVTKLDNLKRLEDENHVRMSEVFPMSNEMKIVLKSLGNLEFLPGRDDTSPKSRKSCFPQVQHRLNSQLTKLKFGSPNSKTLRPTLRPMFNKTSAYKINAVGDSRHQDVQMFQKLSRTKSTKAFADTAVFDRLLCMHGTKKGKSRKLVRANTIPKDRDQNFGDAEQARERPLLVRSFACPFTRAWEMKSEDIVQTRPRAATFSGFEQQRNDKTATFCKSRSLDWNSSDKVDTLGDQRGLHSEKNAPYRRNHYRKSFSQSLPSLQSKLVSGDVGTAIALKCEKWLHWRNTQEELRANESDEETENSA